MRRVRDEQGAVAVVVALLMVPLIAFAAISLDVAGLHLERQRLQASADAAVLGIAQDCGLGTCGTPSLTASALALVNGAPTGATTSVLTPLLGPGSGTATVRTQHVRQHAFAPVVGVDATLVEARATARWGAPSGGTAVLPLAFSWCDFSVQTAGGLVTTSIERTIHFTKTSPSQCFGPSGNVVPGGFGWLTPNLGGCTRTSAVGGILSSDPGESVPSSCSTASFTAVQGKTVLLPLYDRAGGTGSSAWYQVYGYAAFTLTGYYFGGPYSWNGGTCRGNDRCIRGYFSRFVDLSDAWQYSATAPKLGASVVSLTS